MKLIAHRGASGYAPENTLASFIKAIEMGAKAIEFDVQMTKDGQLVVIHDFFLDRTTNGEGLIMDKEYGEIRSYDAGSSFDASFSQEYVPLLEEVLGLFPKDIEIHLEIKKIGLDKRLIEEEIYQVIKNKGLLDKTIFSSFDHHCLTRLLKHKGVRTGMLIASSMVEPIAYMEKNGLLSYSVNEKADFVSKELVEEIHKANLQLNTFTVNNKSIAKYFEQIGVDGIFTNYLDILDK